MNVRLYKCSARSQLNDKNSSNSNYNSFQTDRIVVNNYLVIFLGFTFFVNRSNLYNNNMNYLPFIHYLISGYSIPNSILFSFKVYKCKQVVHSFFFQKICNSRKSAQLLMFNSFLFAILLLFFVFAFYVYWTYNISEKKFHYVCLIHVELRKTVVAIEESHFQ